jgi:hypothetical protein
MPHVVADIETAAETMFPPPAGAEALVLVRDAARPGTSGFWATPEQLADVLERLGSPDIERMARQPHGPQEINVIHLTWLPDGDMLAFSVVAAWGTRPSDAVH